MNEHDKAQTESQTRKTRGVENRDTEFPIYSNRTEGIDRQGGIAQRFLERDARTNRAGSDPFGIISQQVIKRLIWQASDRLQEAKDCIDWYQNQVDKLTKEIEELEQLEQLVEDSKTTDEEE